MSLSYKAKNSTKKKGRTELTRSKVDRPDVPEDVGGVSKWGGAAQKILSSTEPRISIRLG